MRNVPRWYPIARGRAAELLAAANCINGDHLNSYEVRSNRRASKVAGAGDSDDGGPADRSATRSPPPR